jgi:adenosylcobinamide-GDP ribazoletransferase
VLIGLAAAAIAWGACYIFPSFLASVVVVIVLLSASGGFHLDGLSDTADGFLSSRPRERILDIMKDSHIGAMGAIAIFCILILKIAALAALPPGQVWRAALLMPIVGRCAMVLALAALPYARPEGGLGTIFSQRRNPALLGWAGLFLAAACVVVLGWAGLVTAVTALAATAVFCWYSFHRIGGATGDVFGATCELMEFIPPLVMVVGAGATNRGVA